MRCYNLLIPWQKVIFRLRIEDRWKMRDFNGFHIMDHAQKPITSKSDSAGASWMLNIGWSDRGWRLWSPSVRSSGCRRTDDLWIRNWRVRPSGCRSPKEPSQVLIHNECDTIPGEDTNKAGPKTTVETSETFLFPGASDSGGDIGEQLWLSIILWWHWR